MRIKRFHAPDMRTALRMVREAQGADAVILSSRQTPEGVEIVAATDYDEALVQQALRTISGRPASAAPAPETPPSQPPVANGDADSPSASADLQSQEFATILQARMQASAPRERAVFPIGVEPSASAPRQADLPSPSAATPSRLEQVMAVLKGSRHPRTPPIPPPSSPALVQEVVPPSPLPEPSVSPLPVGAAHEPPSEPASPPSLHRVEPDPAMTALRAELAAMRKIIERELGQLAAERLRGAPARAAALELLASFGCDEALAQQVASTLDPTLPPDAIIAPLRNALAARLPVLQEEPLDTGGILAVLGPTGAGKTTTVAKLAARYAACHGPRDVALVSADHARAGAREQLHVLGRRLGISVCDAEGPEALNRVLEQLSDYPLVLIDTAGYGLRDRALLRQILWVRAASHIRSLLVVPANTHPADLDELLRRYRPAAPEGAILTKLDETTRPGAALSVLVHHGLALAYTTAGQCVPEDITRADAMTLTEALEHPHRPATIFSRHDDGQHARA